MTDNEQLAGADTGYWLDHTERSGSIPPDPTVVIPVRPAQPPPSLAWEDDGTDNGELRFVQSWRLAFGYAAVFLSCALVLAFAIAVIGWVVVNSGGLPAVVTSDQINGTAG